MLRTTAFVLIVAVIIVVIGVKLYQYAKTNMIDKINLELPNSEIKMGIYFPWPMGPMIIGHLDAKSELYRKQLVNPGVIETQTFKIGIYPSDGNVIIEER